MTSIFGQDKEGYKERIQHWLTAKVQFDKLYRGLLQFHGQDSPQSPWLKEPYGYMHGKSTFMVYSQWLQP